LQDYLTALHGKTDPRTGARDRPADPAAALHQLTGQTLPLLEKDLQQYILRLSAPGQAAP